MELSTAENLAEGMFTSTLAQPSVSSTCMWYIIGIRVILGSTLILVGVIGNGFSIVILSGDQNRSPTVRMLLYLAIADSFVLIVYGSMTVIYPYLVVLGHIKMAHNIQVFCITYIAHLGHAVNQLSVLFTVSVTSLHYMSICRPHALKSFKTIRTTNIIAIISVIFTVIFFAPSFFQSEMRRDAEGSLYVIPSAFGGSTMFQVFYSVTLFYIISYILPVISLVYIASALTHTWFKMKKKTVVMRTAKGGLTASVIAVAIVFIICQSFGPLEKLVRLMFGPFHVAVQCGHPLFFIGPLILISHLVNSASNFLIYLLFAKRFRKQFQALIWKSNAIAPEMAVTSTQPDFLANLHFST